MENLKRSVQNRLFLYKEMCVLKERVFWVRKMSDIAGTCPLAAVLISISSLSRNKDVAQSTEVYRSKNFKHNP